MLPAVAVNEVESNGDATDWVEVVNTGSQPIDLTGWTLIDSDPIGHAADVTPVAAGTTLAPGAFFVFDGGSHFSFGLGGADVASIRNAAGLTVVEYAWADHAAVTWARCPDGTGDFAAATVAVTSASCPLFPSKRTIHERGLHARLGSCADVKHVTRAPGLVSAPVSKIGSTVFPFTRTDRVGPAPSWSD